MNPRSESLRRASRCRLCIVAACVLVGGCASSGDVQGSQDAVDSSDSVVEIAESDASPFDVRQSSGYLRKLLDSTYGPEEAMIAYRYGPDHALETADYIVAGYLFEIVPGVTIVDTSRGQSMTPVQVRVQSAFADQIEEQYRTEGATEGDWQDLQRMRDNIAENKPSRPYVESYWAYRIRITEVVKGDFNVNDIIEIQVYAGLNVGKELSAPVLEGTPRVVVGGRPGSPGTGNFELRDSKGETILDQATWGYPDLFWFDESTWDARDDGASGAQLYCRVSRWRTTRWGSTAVRRLMRIPRRNSPKLNRIT